MNNFTSKPRRDLRLLLLDEITTAITEPTTSSKTTPKHAISVQFFQTLAIRQHPRPFLSCRRLLLERLYCCYLVSGEFYRSSQRRRVAKYPCSVDCELKAIADHELFAVGRHDPERHEWLA
jgi:hypothetical protein